jgi:protein-disulfide isomerase
MTREFLRDVILVVRPVTRTLALTTALAVSMGLADTWRAAHAQNRIDPKLREQVLQIIRENPEVVLEAVRDYQKQQQQAREKARQSVAQQIKANPRAMIGQSPTRGATNNRVVLVEFSDFQCPYCAKARASLKQFVTKHQDKVTLVYKHFPLTRIHPEALPAAKASWAAAQQGKFWEFHDALFEQQERLGDELYVETAKALGLDMQRFNRDRASTAASAAIEQDMQLAANLGVDGTPYFMMNGEVFSGVMELAQLEEVLARVSR